jgi:ABC-type multidrug transport system ATPase subunit
MATVRERRVTRADDRPGHNERADAQVLYNVRGVVAPTEVLGLMGPSGSGKTSLISVLGGRKPPAMTVTGDVSFNGVPLSRMLQSSMGFVLQDDILFDSLTVFETLYFAARLRLPHDMSLCVPPHALPRQPANTAAP